MSTAAATLAAGGIVPVGAKLDQAESVDTVGARAYRHPVLGERVVVRLTAETVAAGDDLEMAVLGFGAAEVRGAVGKERRRALGFPAWALVNDPANARYALDVVGELKQHARRAKSKPGFAKEGIDKLAETLGKTVPQFLPSFYEEAGRAFVLHGAPSFAATCFGKAREAEAVHALDVDEPHRVDAFLEFALAGAVTTKALAAYAKDLAAHHAPAVAYAHFRQLCVQRTLGGMPPWGGMAKELRRLAKAAKLDVAAEDAALVAEIVASPALGKASAELWREYAAPLVALGKSSPAALLTLVELFPTGTRASGPEVDEAWLDVVEASGGIAALLASPPGAPAAWFDKLVGHLTRHWRKGKLVRPFGILRQLAPRLAADGVAIHAADPGHNADLDLAELALERGIPVAIHTPRGGIELNRWLARVDDPEGRRDPVRVAAHPQLAVHLEQIVGQYIGTDPFDARSAGLAGFLAAKRAWLAALLARGAAGGLPDLDEVLGVVAAKAKAALFTDLPEQHAALLAIDVAPVLARSLRGGIYDELGWPALEAAAEELAPGGKDVTVHGGLPAVVVASATRVIAVGATGRLAAFDLVLPPKHVFHSARYIGGQFLVASWAERVGRASWSAAPHETFVLEGWPFGYPAIGQNVALLADGAWREGTTTIRVGEQKRPAGKLAAFDGATAWVMHYATTRYVMRELGETGEPGRASWPAFIEAYSKDDWLLDAAASYVVPAPAGLTASPLGLAGGMLGLRVRLRRPPNAWTIVAREVERIDGASASGADGLRAAELLDLPGVTRPRIVYGQAGWNVDMAIHIAEPDSPVRISKVGADRRYLRGAPVALPLELWHHLSPRDVAGSLRLRAVTTEDARALVDATAPGRTAAELAELVPVDAVRARLPALTDARLVRGVAGHVALAAQLQATRDALAADRIPGAAAAGAPLVLDEETLAEATRWWLGDRWGNGHNIAAQIAQTAQLFGSADRRDRYVPVPDTALCVPVLFVAHGALAFLATARGTPPAARVALATLLAVLARTFPDLRKLRVTTTTGEIDAALPGASTRAARWHGGNAYLVHAVHDGGSAKLVVEYAPDGVWRGLPGLQPVETWTGGGPLSPDEIAAVIAAAARPETSSWTDDGPAQLAAATGITASEAAFLLAGCPNATNRSANFLPKERREAMGLKAAQAALARDALTALAPWKRLAVIDAAGRRGVAALMAGAAPATLAAAWVERLGKRVPVPEALVIAADAELAAPLAAPAALAMIADAAAPSLTVDGVWALDSAGAVIAVRAPEPLVGQTALPDAPVAFTAAVASTIAAYLPFLFAELPVGAPLRACVAEAYTQTLARLAAPGFMIDAGTAWVYGDAMQADATRVLANLGGEEITGLADEAIARRLPGAVVTRSKTRAYLALWPAALDAQTLAALQPAIAWMAAHTSGDLQRILLVRSPDFAAFAARIRETPVPIGGWEQDPRASVPALVDRATAALGVSRDAAALYLQYLVLAWPTPKALQAWNNWKPKQLAAAQAELVAAELLLEAKRERAQRTHFLPGGWEAHKSPLAPMELWKEALYGGRRPDGTPLLPLERHLPLAPFHLLFARAWARIDAGDVPKYDEVKR